MYRPIVKYHGGKHYLASWLIREFPQHDKYIEPFGGAASVLMRKKKSESEIYNDLDKSIYSIFYSLQNDDDFINKIKKIEYTETNFNKALNNEFEYSVNCFVLRRMSRGGLMKTFSWSERLRGGKPGDYNAFETFKTYLPIIKKRIENVKLYNIEANIILRNNDNNNTFIYLDPPYLLDTRTAKNIYNFEMTNDEHKILLELCNNSKSKIMISGYENELYNYFLKNWRKRTLNVINNSGQNKNKEMRKECAWLNY